MANNKTEILVYLDTYDMPAPMQIGTLTASMSKNRRAYSFSYHRNWLSQTQPFFLDPDISWFSGTQYPADKPNFGVIFDSMPDTWGRTLVKRKEAIGARKLNEVPRTLHDLDFLLAVHDKNRMGALRFKTDPNGDFLDNDGRVAVPPWSSVRELQHSVKMVESDSESAEIQKWLAVLMAPGSSLGGARPKANILDTKKHPWIAKFPAKNDTTDKGLWEYLTYKLALLAGVEMAESKVEKVAGYYHTFFTKRFDRKVDKRIHFASAMCLTGNNEEHLRHQTASYLEIAEFIQYNGTNVKVNLHQLWRRIVFNIAVSNTDDHLRNHGFLLKENNWHLSPAYDINPSVDKQGLALNIDLYDNALDFDLAKTVGIYFQLNNHEMDAIINEVKGAVKNWGKLAAKIGIPRKEQELMRGAFRV